MLIMIRHLIFAVALLLSICAPLRFAAANETGYASQDSVDSTFSFYRGPKLRIQASGTPDDSAGLGVLRLKEFKVFLDGQRIDEKRFDKLISTLGVKLGTIQVSCETMGESPETISYLYAITFDYEAAAYASLEAYPFETRKHMRVEFDATGIKKVTSTGSVSQDFPLD